MARRKQTTPFRDAEFTRKRMSDAVHHLATSHHKLKKRVLDAYDDHVSGVSPTANFFPDRETLNDIEAIRNAVQKECEKIEKNPGVYEALLRRKQMTSLEIAKNTLDYRIARKLANMIADLHFKLEAGLVVEYKDELRVHAKGAR
jgi:hypothetical protein